MKTPTRFSHVAAFALLALLAGACANQKEPAQQAIASAETAVQGVAADAQKYVPGRYAELTNSLADLKANFDKGDYKAVVAGAPNLMTMVKAVGDEAMAKKTEVMNALQGDWASLSGSVPQMVDAIQSRVNILSSAKKLPANVSTEAFDSAKSGLDGMKQMWNEASTAFTSGDIESAVTKAKSVQAKGNEILSLLGMTSSQ